MKGKAFQKQPDTRCSDTRIAHDTRAAANAVCSLITALAGGPRSSALVTLQCRLEVKVDAT